jgi:hypothetical protein
MRLQVMKAAGVGIALVVLLGACGSSSKKTVATTPPTQAPAATTTTTEPPNPYKLTVTPSTGLTNGQAVTVAVSGFTAGKTLGINECSSTTDDSGSGCDLGGIKQIKVGADGTASTTFNVKVGPFGADKVVCTSLQAPDTCLLSAGELIADPKAQRSNTIDIKFAG